MNPLPLPSTIEDCYDSIATKYAEKFLNELNEKPFDRAYLQHFYEVNQFQGTILDLGCGPGQTTKFLYDCGSRDLIGLDLSSKMIDLARFNFPQITFQMGTMFCLPFENHSIGGITAFYSIVNCNLEELEQVFQEIYRVLKENGQVLFSFHMKEGHEPSKPTANTNTTFAANAAEPAAPASISPNDDDSNAIEIIHLTEFFDTKMEINFYFFELEHILQLLKKKELFIHFEIVDVIIRYPYPHEHPSKRVYILAQKAPL